MKNIQAINAEYMFQEETGANGTPHLQGYLYFKNAVSFKKVKELIPRAHIEKMKNKIASMKYCSKEETRTGAIFTNVSGVGTVGTIKKIKKLSCAEDVKNYNDELFFYIDMIREGRLNLDEIREDMHEEINMILESEKNLKWT